MIGVIGEAARNRLFDGSSLNRKSICAALPPERHTRGVARRDNARQSLHSIQNLFVECETLRLFSVTAVTPGDVMTDADPLEAEVKRAMLEHARCAVLLADGSKFGGAALSAIAPLSEVGTVILADADRSRARALARGGTEVVEV